MFCAIFSLYPSLYLVDHVVVVAILNNLKWQGNRKTEKKGFAKRQSFNEEKVRKKMNEPNEIAPHQKGEKQH